MENHHFKFQEVSQFSELSLAILNYRRVDDRHIRRTPKPAGLVQKAPRTQGKPQLRISQGPSEEGHLVAAVEEILLLIKKMDGQIGENRLYWRVEAMVSSMTHEKPLAINVTGLTEGMPLHYQKYYI